MSKSNAFQETRNLYGTKNINNFLLVCNEWNARDHVIVEQFCNRLEAIEVAPYDSSQSKQLIGSALALLTPDGMLKDTDRESVLYVGPDYAQKYCSIAIRKPLHELGSWELQDIPVKEYINTNFKTSITKWILNKNWGDETTDREETRYVKDESSIDVIEERPLVRK